MKMLYFTKEGLEKLKNDYEQAKEAYNVASSEFYKLSKDIDSASSVEFANLNLCASQLKQLDAIIKAPFILIEEMPEFKNWDGTTVIRKCEVTLNYDGDVETYKILGSNESNLYENILSCDALLSEKLIGHKVNDEIIVNNTKITILEIKPVSKTKTVDGPVLDKAL